MLDSDTGALPQDSEMWPASCLQSLPPQVHGYMITSVLNSGAMLSGVRSVVIFNASFCRFAWSLSCCPTDRASAVQSLHLLDNLSFRHTKGPLDADWVWKDRKFLRVKEDKSLLPASLLLDDNDGLHVNECRISSVFCGWYPKAWP